MVAFEQGCYLFWKVCRAAGTHWTLHWPFWSWYRTNLMDASTLSSVSSENRCSFHGQPPCSRRTTSPLGSTWNMNTEHSSGPLVICNGRKAALKPIVGGVTMSCQSLSSAVLKAIQVTNGKRANLTVSFSTRLSN